jgi:hypothetical protein
MALAALIVAIVAAMLSLISLGWTIAWSIWQHRQVTRGRLYVRASMAFDVGRDAHVFAISVTNNGVVPVTIAGLSAYVPGAQEHLVFFDFLQQAPSPLPCVLQPGERWQALHDADGFRRGVARIAPGPPPWKVTVSVRDAGDVHHDSKPYEITRSE